MKKATANPKQTISDLVVTAIGLEGVQYWALGFKDTHQVLAITGKVGDGKDEESVEMATRIVACLKVCDGIDIEMLNFFADKVAEKAKRTAKFEESRLQMLHEMEMEMQGASDPFAEISTPESISMSFACIDKARQSSSTVNRDPK
jgi:hypothetical protein